MIYLTLTAPNTKDGNRRQLWVVMTETGIIKDIIRHEDGKGMCEPSQVYPGIFNGPAITVSVKEFDRYLKMKPAS